MVLLPSRPLMLLQFQYRQLWWLQSKLDCPSWQCQLQLMMMMMMMMMKHHFQVFRLQVCHFHPHFHWKR